LRPWQFFPDVIREERLEAFCILIESPGIEATVVEQVRQGFFVEAVFWLEAEWVLATWASEIVDRRQWRAKGGVLVGLAGAVRGRIGFVWVRFWLWGVAV
jgi:hypothetical protein